MLVIETIGTIKNPLTIIAMFAAIAEISGTAVLPFISATNQAIYVWFLIVFPILLVLLFFGTLNFNHGALYAPSDYQNEDNFLHSLSKATIVERVEKVEEEEKEEEEPAALLDRDEENKLQTQPATPNLNASSIFSARIPNVSSRLRNFQSSYFLVEELVFQLLGSEFRTNIQRGIRVHTPNGNYVFDGIVVENGITTVIEVKLLRSLDVIRRSREAIQKLLVASRSLIYSKRKIRLLLVIVTDSEIPREKIVSELEMLRSTFSESIETRVYEFDDLKRKAGLIQ
jgi:hypothetical protein